MNKLKNKIVKSTSKNNINWKKLAQNYGTELIHYKRKCNELTSYVNDLQGDLQDMQTESRFLIVKLDEYNNILNDIEKHFRDDSDGTEKFK